MKPLFTRLIDLLIGTSMLIAFLANAIASPDAAPPKPATVANTCPCTNPNVPLDQPNISAPPLLVWANTAAVSAFTYNFVNYQSTFPTMAAYFTPDGWKAFKDALDKSENLQTVIKNKLVVSAVAEGAPLILQEGAINGIYTWKIQMPLLVTYQSALGSNIQHSIVTMVIERTKSNVTQNGFGIKQFDVTPAPASKAKHETT